MLIKASLPALLAVPTAKLMRQPMAKPGRGGPPRMSYDFEVGCL
jgi:hypothetical protein